MASRTTVTAPQLVALRRVLASPSGYIMRLAGGFWITPETPMSGHVFLPTRFDDGGSTPSWSTSAQTIASCERAGLLERTHAYSEAWRDNHRLTPAGEAIARSAPIPKLTPTMRRNLADFAREDQGFPIGATDLETLGYVEKHGNGWRVTAEGAAALARTRP